MATIFDVADFILHEKGEMSAWKLQKLCYYSQVWAYTWTEKPLFSQRFEAWVNGPVCPDLFRMHRGKYMVKPGEIIGNRDVLNEDEKDTVTRVLEYYGGRTPSELREQTHSEPPWLNARGDKKDGEPCNTEITLEAMGEYYGSL